MVLVFATLALEECYLLGFLGVYLFRVLIKCVKIPQNPTAYGTVLILIALYLVEYSRIY